jgi:hypothetical protein
MVDGNLEYKAELSVCTAHVQTLNMEPSVRAGIQHRWAERAKREIMEQSESLGSLLLRAKPSRVLEANKKVAL